MPAQYNEYSDKQQAEQQSVAQTQKSSSTQHKRRKTKEQLKRIKQIKQQMYECDANIREAEESLKQIRELDVELKRQQDKINNACSTQDLFVYIRHFLVDGFLLQLRVALYIVLISTFVYMNVGYINGRNEIIKRYSNPKVLQHSKARINIDHTH